MKNSWVTVTCRGCGKGFRAFEARRFPRYCSVVCGPVPKEKKGAEAKKSKEANYYLSKGWKKKKHEQKENHRDIRLIGIER